MLPPLAYAEPAADGSNLTFILLGLGAFLLVIALALVPVVVAWSRRHRAAETVIGLTILWSLLAAGSLLLTTMDHLKWSRERTLRLQSGYYDPQQVDPDAPKWPITFWAALGAGYVAIVAWSAIGKSGGGGAGPPS